MSMRIWVLTILYVLLMLLVGLKPLFGVVFSYTSVIVIFLVITFLVFTFLATENKGSKIRTIVRYFVIVILSGIAFYFIDFEVRTHHIGKKVSEVVHDVMD